MDIKSLKKRLKLSTKAKVALSVPLFALLAGALSSKAQDANIKMPASASGNVRISWDYNTYKEMTSVNVSNKNFTEKNLYYPRIKKLSDGTLLMSFSNDHFGWNIYVRRSTDNGKTWSDAQLLRERFKSSSTMGEDETVFVNPDFIELKDGRILLAYQWRYKKGYYDVPNTNINCGIEIMFSSDKGKNFTEPREVYKGRCWEPSMLELPSGEIQMYITSSQEVVNKVSNPRTVIIRSNDGGKTWQGKKIATHLDNEMISHTVDERFGYDGMATAVSLDDNNGIAVPLEVWSGKLVVDQTPVIVKTTVEKNWRGEDQKKMLEKGGPDYPNKKQINKDLVGYGPYSTKLGTGEMVVLSNGTYKGEEGIWTLIGDKKADNFRFATSPFDGYWGSIDYTGNNTVIATGTVKYKDKGGDTRGKVVVMHGRLNYAKTITKGDLVMPTLKKFDRENNDYWFLGKKTPGAVFSNFAYTDQEFILGTYLLDKNLVAFTPENSDASILLLSRKSSDGQRVNYKIVVNAEGNFLIYREENYSWHLIKQGKTKDIQVVGTVNQEEDEDLGYAVKLKIDWNILGGTPSSTDTFNAQLRHHYKKNAVEKPRAEIEYMEGENSDYPEEWLSLTLK